MPGSHPVAMPPSSQLWQHHWLAAQVQRAIVSIRYYQNASNAEHGCSGRVGAHLADTYWFGGMMVDFPSVIARLREAQLAARPEKWV